MMNRLAKKVLRRRRVAQLIVVMIGAASCAPPPAAAPPEPGMNKTKIIVRIRPSQSSVGGTVEKPEDDDGVAGIIWIENRSTDTVAILSVTLHDCINVRPTCEVPLPQKLKLAPNARHRIMKVQRTQARVAWRFTYTYEWSAAGAVRTGINSAETQLYPSDIGRLGEKIKYLVADPDSVTLEKTGVLVASQLHIVAQDSTHAVLGQFRGSFTFRVTEGTVMLIPPDTLIAVDPGRRVLTVTPENPRGTTRDSKLPVLKINLIVK